MMSKAGLSLYTNTKLLTQPFSTKAFSTVALLVLCGASTSAQARILEEVVVTAQKRAESVQDVPMGITALSAQAIANAGITSTADIVKLAPSLTFAQGTNKQNSGFSIRGVGTQVFSIGVESSVAVVIDDVSTVQSGQSLTNLADVERIEILRGPQSTLFGKSASAGLINVTTKAPADEFEGSFDYQLTDDDQNRLAATVSGPVSEALSYRLSGHWDDYGGYSDNLTNGSSINTSESTGLRGKLRWAIGEATQFDLGVYYSKDEGDCCNLTWAMLDPTAQVFGLVPGDVALGIKPSDKNRKARLDTQTDSIAENTGINGRFVVDVGEHTLTSITALDNWQYENAEDVDRSDVDVLAFFTAGESSGGFSSTSEVETDYFSQELRIASPVHESHDYLLGFFYADAETDRLFRRNIGLPILPSSWDATMTTKSMAAFGQFNWRITQALELSTGIRWNEEEISIDYVNNLDALGGEAGNTDSDTEVLANLSLQYTFSDDVMLYARYAQGYKGQAFNVVTGFIQEDADNPVSPETSDSFEIGFRSTLMEQRLQLNGTVFYSEYVDFQAQNTVVTPQGDFINKLRNVGELESYGAEFDAIALIGENLTINAGLTYLETEIISFDGAPCYSGQTEAEGCVNETQNLEGSPLSNAPQWKYNVGVDYRQKIADMPFDGFINLSYNWKDEVHYGVTVNPLQRQDSYGVANLSLGINAQDDQYRVSLFVNNVFDESYRNIVADARQLFGQKLAVLQNLPRDSQRYYGVRLNFRF